MTGCSRSSFRIVSRKDAAFTLVELLVVVAVIALLIGVLLPALAGARSSGFQMKGAANQRQLVLGINRWANDNDGQIPGVNTSGRSLENIDDEDTAGKLSRSADKPTQNFDWISCAVGTDMLPEPRGERFIRIWEEFGDPTVSDIIGTDGVKKANTKLVEALNKEGGMAMPSVLMPASWQWAGRVQGSKHVMQPPAEANVAELPGNWFPRIANVGAESLKVAISDGFGNLEALEIDGGIWAGENPNVKENEYGAFCSSTPIQSIGADGSKNFYFSKIALKDGNPKAYRHKGKMNAGFWDGHVTTLTYRESQNPALWFPKGSKMGAKATKEALEVIKSSDIIN